MFPRTPKKKNFVDSGREPNKWCEFSRSSCGHCLLLVHHVGELDVDHAVHAVLAALPLRRGQCLRRESGRNGDCRRRGPPRRLEEDVRLTKRQRKDERLFDGGVT